MKRFSYILIIVLSVFLLTGCFSNAKDSRMGGISTKSSITDKKVKNYRVNVLVTGVNLKEEYTVVNKENKLFDIAVIQEEETFAYQVDRTGKKEKNTSGRNDLKDYTNTDIFLTSLKKVTNVKESKEKLDGVEYKKYDFEITKEDMNEILKVYGAKTDEAGTGYVYIDKNERAYIVNYGNSTTSISATYSNYDVK